MEGVALDRVVRAVVLVQPRAGGVVHEVAAHLARVRVRVRVRVGVGVRVRGGVSAISVSLSMG